MCGIIAGISSRNIVDILLAGLERLEYRGYDSAGLAVLNGEVSKRIRRVGKVEILHAAVRQERVVGTLGIAHTRWATHGRPTEENAHPHQAGNIYLVHNGIIDNYEEMRSRLMQNGAVFHSDTDSEVVAHAVSELMSLNPPLALFEAVKQVRTRLVGAYGAVFFDHEDDSCLVAARSGSPLVIGLGDDECFVASDQIALAGVVNRVIFLEEGDVAKLCRDKVTIVDKNGKPVLREIVPNDHIYEDIDKGAFSHYMLKEIYDQPTAIQDSIQGRLDINEVKADLFGSGSDQVLSNIEHVFITACGTSSFSAMVARYWFEEIAGISCSVEIASEFRYRKSAFPEKSLFVSISQSGETADTLAALRHAKGIGFSSTLAICNVEGSSLVRESAYTHLMRAGVEISVASTKAFTSQLVALLLLALKLAELKGLKSSRLTSIRQQLLDLPAKIEDVLGNAPLLENWAKFFLYVEDAFFLGRGVLHPISMEAAIKLKEISYIHAESCAMGEFLHGPISVLDHKRPVVVLASAHAFSDLLDKDIDLLVDCNAPVFLLIDINKTNRNDINYIEIGEADETIFPILMTVAIQLLSFYVAKLKGTDIDQPRNLAKSVTVE